QRRAIATLRDWGAFVMTEPGDVRREIPSVVPDEFFVEACRVNAGTLSKSFRTTAAGEPSRQRWAPLGHLHTLRWLSLFDTAMDDEGMAYVQNLVALESLCLTNSPVTDQGLSHVAGLEKLRWLYLDGTQVGDAGLAQLAGLSRLAWLELDHTKIGDEGL